MPFLTKKEKYILMFLAISAIIGISYAYYKEYYPPIRIASKKERFKPKFFERKDLDLMLQKEKTVNINTASLEDLMRLKGVGGVLANRIIEYRNDNGPFKDKEEIKNVTGLGDSKFNEIKDRIVTE